MELGRIDRPSQTLEPEAVGLTLEDGKRLLHSLQQSISRRSFASAKRNQKSQSQRTLLDFSRSSSAWLPEYPQLLNNPVTVEGKPTPRQKFLSAPFHKCALGLRNQKAALPELQRVCVPVSAIIDLPPVMAAS